jgi:hypothetical protein
VDLPGDYYRKRLDIPCPERVGCYEGQFFFFVVFQPDDCCIFRIIIGLNPSFRFDFCHHSIPDQERYRFQTAVLRDDQLLGQDGDERSGFFIEKLSDPVGYDPARGE